VYAHASKVFAKKGDLVRQGQIIAAVGKSGDTTGPHLHYEVRVQGSAQDPRAYGLASGR
ncbi:MAG TPA: M23 family metallopeptidase, partial [bacterium]|nr:M23 family metallopeptidase [bacterium]